MIRDCTCFSLILNVYSESSLPLRLPLYHCAYGISYVMNMYMYIWNINNLRYASDTTLMVESEEELKSLSMKVKEWSEKAGLKLNIRKMKIMASGPITSWQTDGETMETVTDFIFWAPKSLQIVTTTMKLKDTCSLVEILWQTWTVY